MVTIGADISNLTTGLTTTGTKLTNFGQNAGTTIAGLGTGITSLGNKMTSLGGNITTALQPFTDAALAGLDAASGFEDVMSQLQIFGGLAGDELENVRDLALQLGADTKFSAADAAGAMLELTKAGMTVPDAMTTVKSTLDLAAAGNLTLADSAGIVSTALAQFGLDASDSAYVVNTLASAALASRADVDTLAQGLSNVGPVAASAGLDLNDTAAALAVLANAGIDGAEAGTQLKSLLLNFNSDTAKDEFNKLGVSLYDASGNTRNFDDVLDELKVSLAAMTPEEKATAMKNLAGSYGITALNALLAADGIDTMQTSMEAAPDAANLASAGMATFSGKVESLKGSVETLMITALTPLMDDVLSPLTDTVTEIVNAITDWADKNPEAASAIGGVVLAVAGLGVVLTIVGGAVTVFGGVITALGTGIAILTSPIALLAGAIGLLIAVINNPDVQAGLAAWQGVFDNLKTIVDFVGQSIQAKLNDIASAIRAFFRDIEQTMLDIQIKAADVQIALGINYDANVADKNAKQAQLNASNLAENLETGINTGLAAGDINIDPSQYVNVDYAALASKITNPMLIQDAMTKAMAEGDQQALDVLLPLATELGIDTQSLVDQFATSLTTAGSQQIYNATLTADVLVNAGKVDLGPLRGAINAAIANGNLAGNVPQVPNAATPAPAASAVPHLATGGYIKSEGMAYLHAGEVVLNQGQQAAAGGGGRAANVTFNTNMSIDAMIAELERRGYTLPRGYAGEAAL